MEMKRNNSRNSRKDPLRMRYSSIIRDLAVPNKISRTFSTTVTGVSEAVAPKTSEYAFFKKLKKDACTTLCSHPRPSVEKRIRKFKSSCVTGMANKNRNMDIQGLENIKAPSVIENVPPMCFSFPLPSPDRGHRILVCQYEDVFYHKRQKMHHLVADAAVPEDDEFSFKGCDMISLLLGRLLPKTNEIRSNLPKVSVSDISKSDIHFSGSKRDVLDFGFPASSCVPINNYLCSFEDNDSDSHSGRLEYFRMENDIPVDRYGSPVSSHFSDIKKGHNVIEPNTLLLGWDVDSMRNKQDFSLTPRNVEPHIYAVSPNSCDDNDHLDRSLLCNGNEPVLGNESNTLLLSWDFDNMNNEQDLLAVSPNRGMGLYTVSSPTSWGIEVHHDDIRDNECVLEEYENLPVILNRLLPTPPCTPSFLDMAKDRSIMVSHSSHCFMDDSSSECQKPDMEALLSFPLTKFSDENCISHHAPQFQDVINLGFIEEQFEIYSDNSCIREAINCFTEYIHDLSSTCVQQAFYDSNKTGYSGAIEHFHDEGDEDNKFISDW